MCASNSSKRACVCEPGEVEEGGLPREAGGTTGDAAADEGSDCRPSEGAADRGNVAGLAAQAATRTLRTSASTNVLIARIVRVSPPVRARSFSGESAESG